MPGCKSSACVNEGRKREGKKIGWVERVAGKTKAKPAEKLDYFVGGGARARELRRFPPSFVTAAAKPM